MAEHTDPNRNRPPARDETEPQVESDVVSDPNLDDPTDPSSAEQQDEGTSSDWSDEGGATDEGPATDSGPARAG